MSGLDTGSAVDFDAGQGAELMRRSDARPTIQPITPDVERSDPGRSVDGDQDGEHAGEQGLACYEQEAASVNPAGIISSPLASTICSSSPAEQAVATAHADVRNP